MRRFIDMHRRITAIVATVLALCAGGADTPPGSRNFADRVVERPSVVYLKGFHAATQRGPTCNVYSTWMILRYYKHRITPSQIKKGAVGNEYKTSKFIEEKLREEDFCFLIYHPKQGTDFADVVKTCIDNGIPMQWGVNLKYAPDADASPSNPLRDAGHARVIWGYERDRKSGRMTKIIYGDSWGRGHLRKKVEVDEACHMTMSMSPIFPKDTDPKVVAKLMAIPGMIRNKEPAATDGKPAKKPRRKKPRKGR
jgi:hypothetical protein